jgi:3',5'-cyclic AMP phosphodiesterase CpdA
LPDAFWITGRENEAASFRKHFTVPDNGAGGRTTPGTTYSFNYGNAHFVVLNSESNFVDQKAWLEDDLKSNRQKWTVVSMHKGIYGQSGKSSAFDVWASTLDSYEVDLVLNGHDHVYVRTYPMKNDQRAARGTIYLQSGGSGIKQDSRGERCTIRKCWLPPVYPCIAPLP